SAASGAPKAPESIGPATSSPCSPWWRSLEPRRLSSSGCSAASAWGSFRRRSRREVPPVVRAFLVELHRRRRLACRGGTRGRARAHLAPHPRGRQRVVAAPDRDRPATHGVALARDPAKL